MKKKLVTFLTAILVIASFCALPAAANNYVNTEFEFDFVNDQKQDTAYREKRDTTRVYMYCTSSSNESYYAWAYGEYNGYVWDASIDPINGVVYHYTFSDIVNPEQHMINWVKEYATLNGWDTVYAKIHGEKCIPNRTFIADGVWSPDSI